MRTCERCGVVAPKPGHVCKQLSTAGSELSGELGEVLARLLLHDREMNKSEIISLRAAEAGLDHLEIIVQSAEERLDGIQTRHRIFSDEMVTLVPIAWKA